jgi:ribulose-phosphate 3-epimerase
MKKIPKISYSLLASLGKEKNLSNALFSISNTGIDMIHYDISNNEPTLRLGDIKKLKKCTFLPFDIHIATENPIPQFKNIILEPTDRVTIHVECGYDIKEIIDFKKSINCQLGMALNIETPIEKVIPYLKHIDYVLFMAVTPGVSGMPFSEPVIDKIAKFREKYNDYSITVDGGITDKTAYLIRKYNPDVLISGSFILKDQNYGKQVFKLIGQDLNL